MMARIDVPGIPYEPFSTVSPVAPAIPSVRVNAGPEAFGAGVGAALQQLGRSAEGAGDKLFGRAIEMQNMRTETEVNNAANDLLMKGGDQTEQFLTTMGENAADGLKSHIASMDKLRTDTRAGLSNDYARRMFDRETLGTMRQFQMRAIGHAAGETKKALVQSNTARIQSLHQEILKNSGDDNVFNDNVDKMRELMASNGKIMGWGKDVLENNVRKETSNMMVTRIRGINDTDPRTAKETLERYRNQIDSEQFNVINERVNGQYRTVMTQSGAENVMSNPDGQGYWPSATADQKTALGGAHDLFGGGIRMFMNDNPKTKMGAIENGASRREVYVTTDDIDRDQQKILNSFVRMGINEVNVTKEGNRLKISVPEDYDVSKAPKEPPQSMEHRLGILTDWAQEKMPGDAYVANVATNIGTQKYNAAKHRADDLVRQNVNVSWRAIYPEGGQKAMDEAEFRHNLATQNNGSTEAFDSLPGQVKNKIRTAIYARHAIEDDPQEMFKIRSMTDQEIWDKPLEDVASNTKISQRTVNWFIAQKARIARGDGNPEITHAMSLWNAKLPPEIRDDPTLRNRFKAGLEAILEKHMQLNKVHADAKQIEAYGNAVLSDITVPGLWWGTRTIKAIDYEPTKEDLDRARQDPQWVTWNISPSDAQLQLYAMADMFQRMVFGPRTAEAPAGGSKTVAPATLPAEPPTPAPTPAPAPTKPKPEEPPTEEQRAVPSPRETRRQEREAAEAKVTEEQAKATAAAAAERAKGIEESAASRERLSAAAAAAEERRKARVSGEVARRPTEDISNQIDVLEKREKALLGREGDPLTPEIRTELVRVRSELTRLRGLKK